MEQPNANNTLEEIQKLIYALHTSRVGKHRYNLIPPFTRPRVTIGEGDKTDSRTVILRQAKR